MATLAPTPRKQKITLASASAGPFDLSFRLFSHETLTVFVDGTKTTAFTVQSTFVDGFDDDATITFDAVQPIASVIGIEPVSEAVREQDLTPSPNLIEKMNAEETQQWVAIADLQQRASRSISVPPGSDSEDMLVEEPVAGRALIGRADGLGFEAGPSTDEIASAEGYATDAMAARTAAEAWAETPEDTEVPGNPGRYSALHHAAKAALSEVNATTLFSGLSQDFDDFNPDFNLSPQMDLGGEKISINKSFQADDEGVKPQIGVSVEIDGNKVHGAGNRMFGGVGLFVQARLDGGDETGVQDSFFSSIAGYAVQNLDGDGDGIGVHGRARKTGLAGNIGDAAGVLGDAYQLSTLAGGVMGLEGRIYNSVAGRTAADGYNGGAWETALNLISDSDGSPALAAILVTGEGWNSGKYSFWNGINISRETFAHDGAGAGIAGTVGINMGDWNATWHAETAIKYGTATWHAYRGNEAWKVATNQLYIENPESFGAAGIRVNSKGSTNSYFDLQNAGTFKGGMFWDQSDDTVKMGSVYDADVILRRNSSEKMRLTSQGASVTGAGTAATGFVLKSSEGFNSFIDMKENDVLKAHLFYDATNNRMVMGTTIGENFDLRTNNTTALRIDSSQRVLFGTDAPSLNTARLSVVGLTDSTRAIGIGSIDGNTAGNIGASGEDGAQNKLVINATRGGGGILFKSGDVGRAFMDASGNFNFYFNTFTDGLIKTQKADNSGVGFAWENTAGERIFSYFDGAGADADFVITREGSGQNDIILRHNGSHTLDGTWGVGQVSPDYKLHVTGTFGIKPGASVTPVNNGDIVFEATSNTIMTIRHKGTDGIVRSGTVALS